ncbi:MAG: ATP-binding protein, partial [Salinisphaeraceae bacterium]|nr:ATP-binding protein [Salinisphaeraceae bacterium]
GLLPSGRLARDVQAIESGDTEQLSGNYPNELQPLATALNAMLRNERARQSRYRNALADLAHSLKTPLAAVRNQLHTAGLENESLEQMQQLIDYQLRKANAASGRSFVTPLAIQPQIERLTSALNKVYADRELNFELAIPAELTVRIDQGDFMEIMGNLLDNAARFAEKRINISAKESATGITLSVADDGPGFPEQDRDRLLQRGVRADSQNPGQGIGLAVVAEIVHAHEGSLELSDAPNGGACVSIHLPKQ